MNTRFVNVTDMCNLVNQIGLRPMLVDLAKFIESDYLRWEDFQKCPRTANHSPVGVVELMPVSDANEFSFKYVNGHPQNPKVGLSTVMAFGALSKMDTGFPVLISEMTILTAIRTAATSALAAKHMARKDSQSMAMIGNGAQSEFQIIAFNEIVGISEFRLFDVDKAATEKLVQNLKNEAGLRLTVCDNVTEAVDSVDIITTSTADKNYATILTDSMIKPGVHINAIGGDCPGKTELDKAILERGRVVVEYEPQSRVEGEIQQMPDDFPVIELWNVLQGRATGRHSDSEITIFDSVGFSLEDFSALRFVFSESEKRSIGSIIELIPQFNDVKDLFQCLEIHSQQ